MNIIASRRFSGMAICNEDPDCYPALRTIRNNVKF
jgi:hypothetical protein